MGASLARRTEFVESEPLELWNSILPEFTCGPEDLRRYMERGRWDLVFNAVCYLTGSIEEGLA